MINAHEAQIKLEKHKEQYYHIILQTIENRINTAIENCSDEINYNAPKYCADRIVDKLKAAGYKVDQFIGQDTVCLVIKW